MRIPHCAVLGLILSLGWNVSGGPIKTWHLRSPRICANAINDLSFGDGTYVAVGDGGTILVSNDSLHWARRESGTARYLNRIAFGAGRFVAVGASGVVATSTTGEEWHFSSIGTNEDLGDLCFGNGLFLATTSFSGEVWASKDATNWSRVVKSETAGISSIVWGDDRFVAAGYPVLYSTDGTNWIATTNSIAGTIAYGNHRFLIMAEQPSHREARLWTSVDGMSWTQGVTLDGLGYDSRVRFGNDYFVLSSFATVPFGTFTTIDGHSASWRTNGVPSTMCFDGSRFIAVTDRSVWRSADGVWWEEVRANMPGLESSYAGAQVSIPGRTILLGSIASNARSVPEQLWSTNGLTWNHMKKPSNSGFASFPIYDVVFSAGKFVAISGAGTILVSDDGFSWINPPSGTTVWLRSICAARGYFFIQTDSGMLASTNATTWFPLGAAVTFSDIADDGSNLVAVSQNALLVSPDGVSWSNAFASNYSLSAVVRGNGRFVAVGAGGTILTSSNGNSWSAAESLGTEYLHKVESAAGLFVAVGESGTILSSTDGTTWQRENSGTRWSLKNISWTGHSFIVSGEMDVIFESDPFVNSAPLIGEQPRSVAVHTGTELTLDVIASGSAPLTFHWIKDGQPVGETNSFLYRQSSSLMDAGDYFVIISNAVNTVTSAVATVFVDASVNPARLQLSATPHPELTVSGTAGVEYQVEFTDSVEDKDSWRLLRNVSLNSSAMTIPDVTASDQGRRFYRSTTGSSIGISR